MATKVNLVLAGALAVAWGALTWAEPAVVLDPEDPRTAELAHLEDAYAADRDDPALARALADHYLSLHEPRLAVATLGASSAGVREDPAILHRLAQAYEQTGRIEDAVATAELAAARCARALGTDGASSLTPTPAHRCTEGTYAALEVHTQALSHMARWGVTDVEHDPRARHAYVMAMRSARIVSAER